MIQAFRKAKQIWEIQSTMEKNQYWTWEKNLEKFDAESQKEKLIGGDRSGQISNY